jgi:mRNA-degrading endonuclease RelE of RelBE toxin-antitoxin system
MDILFESTNKFEKELKKFPPKEKNLIGRKINYYCTLLRDNPEQFYKNAYKPFHIKLLNEYESSLYALKINKDIRVILTVDEDPLFEQVIFTLLHVVRHSSLEKTYRSIAESLYQRNIQVMEKGE